MIFFTPAPSILSTRLPLNCRWVYIFSFIYLIRLMEVFAVLCSPIRLVNCTEYEQGDEFGMKRLLAWFFNGSFLEWIGH